MGQGFQPSTTLDVGLLFAAEADRSALDAAVVDLLAREGSFVATGYPRWVDNDARARRVLSFFDLPAAEKEAVATCARRPENPNSYRGYYPARDERGFAFSEKYDLGPEPPGPVPDLPGVEPFAEPNAWPAREPYAGWRAETLAYVEDTRALAMAVLRAIARRMGRDEDGFVDVCAGGNSTLRLLHYFPPPDHFVPQADREQATREDEFGRRIFTQRHIDTGILSILWQDAGAGLQMLGGDGAWRDVPAVPGGLSVHCGDLLKKRTGGLLEATPHRVTGADRERCSLGLFVEPDYDAEVLPPDADAPVTYAGHLLQQFPGRFARRGNSPENAG